MQTTFNDFFINFKSLPPEGTKEFDDLVAWEIEKCLGGITIDGVFFPGFLYWHLNHWWIRDDIEDEYGNIRRERLNASLRDNEWLVCEYLEKCRVEKKGYLHIGVRQFGKSEIMASYLAYHATLFQHTQNVIVGGNDDDLQLLRDKIDFGIRNLWVGIKIPKLDKDTRKNMTRLGFKSKGGEDEIWSYLIIRNVAEGNKTEGPAGVTAKAYATDEIGKFAFAQSFEAAKPAFKSKFGWRCVPILFGCVCAGTKVWDNSCNLINIENLVPENGILGFNKESGVASRENITYWQPPFEKQCYRITTNTGRSLECSEDHPILFRSRDEKEGHRSSRTRKVYFKETKDLKIGEQVSIVEEVDIFSNLEMWEPRLVGWLIGDGSYGFDKTPVLSNCDSEINNYIESNFKIKVEKQYYTKEGKLYKETRIKGICSKLRELGIYGQTKLKKTLPLNIHSYSKNTICELIGGLFDTDGTVGGYNKGVPVISLASASEDLLKEVQLLLQKLGIHGGIKRIKANISEGRKDKSDHFRLSICDKRSINKFFNNITFFLKYKQDNLKKCVDRLKSKKEQIPKEAKGLRFERVINIENIGIKPVYNLTAGVTNTYIANGIVTHNTGGSFEKGADAERFFFNPEANNFLAIENEDINKKTAIFFSGLYRIDCKESTTLGDWLRKEGKISHPTPNLDTYVIQASNKERAKELIMSERREKAKDPDQTEYLKLIMYYPLTPEECFLSSSANIFNTVAAKKHQFNLKEIGFFGEPVDLAPDESGKIIHSFSKKKMISSYPIKHSENKDAPPMIYEFPISDAPYGLYVAGVDPYRQGKAEYSSSLGSVVIFKRMHNILTETFQNMVVATYTARPDEQNEWNETARNLIKYYNARTLVENDEMSFINYMIYKGDERYLEEQPSWLKNIVPNSSVQRTYGIHRSNDTIRDYLHSLLKNYLNEVIIREKGEDGSVIKEILGVTRIPDIMSLEEIIKFNPDGNFDRIVALELAIAMAKHLDPILGKIGEEDKILTSYLQPRKNKGRMFSSNTVRWGQKMKMFK